MIDRPRAPSRFAAAQVALACATLGALVVVASTIPAVVTNDAGGAAFALVFMGWALVPYGAIWLGGRLVSKPWVVGVAGLAALATDIGIRLAVFVFPRGSTAAVALVFSPLVILLVALPAGALVGVLVDRTMQTAPRWVRGLALAARG